MKSNTTKRIRAAVLAGALSAGVGGAIWMTDSANAASNMPAVVDPDGTTVADDTAADATVAEDSAADATVAEDSTAVDPECDRGGGGRGGRGPGAGAGAGTSGTTGSVDTANSADSADTTEPAPAESSTTDAPIVESSETVDTSVDTGSL